MSPHSLKELNSPASCIESYIDGGIKQQFLPGSADAEPNTHAPTFPHRRFYECRDKSKLCFMPFCQPLEPVITAQGWASFR